MKDYPERAGLVYGAGLRAKQQQEEQLGDLPVYASQLVPLEVDGKVADVINIGSISPTGTAGETAEIATGFLNWLLSDEPQPRFREPGTLLTPVIAATVTAFFGRDPELGRQLTGGEFTVETLENVLPWVRLIRDVIDPSRVSDIYAAASWQEQLKRRFGRVLPYTVDLVALHERAAKGEAAAAKSAAERLAEWEADVRKVYPDGVIPEALRRAKRDQLEVTIRGQLLREQQDGKALTDKQEFAVLLSVYMDSPHNVALQTAQQQAGAWAWLAGLEPDKTPADYEQMKARAAWIREVLGFNELTAATRQKNQVARAKRYARAANG